MWQKDAETDKNTRRLVAAEKDQELLHFHENLKSTRKLAASGNSDIDPIYLLPTFHTLRKFSRMCDRDTAPNRVSSCSSSWERYCRLFTFHQKNSPLNLEQKQFRLQEELFIKEKALRETQIRNIHEIGEIKRAQELRFLCTKIERKP